MNGTQETQRRFSVLAALALLVVLAGMFAFRVMARGVGDSPSAPSASIPPALELQLAEIPAPECLNCSSNRNAPLKFQIDLDVLAPLGDGTGNAAEWFKDFTLNSGARWDSDGFPVYSKRRVDGTIFGRSRKMLVHDDPLLLEAEPWADQATCSFYPEIYELEGPTTQIPHLLLFTDLARSWVWRGTQSSDPVAAREDFQRAIRLGRLIRQDHVTLIQDLVGLTCIRMGAEGLYEQARAAGDATTMLAAARVIADHNTIRLSLMSRLSKVDATQHAHWDENGRIRLMMNDQELGRMIGALKEIPERPIRMEGAIGLHIVRHIGSAAQQERATEVLTGLTSDPDEFMTKLAAWLLEAPFNEVDYFGEPD